MFKKLLLVSFVLTATACSSTNNSAKSEDSLVNVPTLSCVFPDSPQQKAPKWVCDESVTGLAVQAMGMNDNGAAGISHQRQLAIVDAQTLLAAQLKNKTTLAIRNYSATKGQAGQMMIAKESSVEQSLEVDKVLSGVRIHQSVISQGKVYYTLIGMDEATLKANIKKVVSQSIKENDELWQPLTVAPAANNLNQPVSQEQLAAAISNYVG